MKTVSPNLPCTCNCYERTIFRCLRGFVMLSFFSMWRTWTWKDVFQIWLDPVKIVTLSRWLRQLSTAATYSIRNHPLPTKNCANSITPFSSCGFPSKISSYVANPREMPLTAANLAEPSPAAFSHFEQSKHDTWSLSPPPTRDPFPFDPADSNFTLN